MLLLDTQPFAKFYSPHVLAEVVAGAGLPPAVGLRPIPDYEYEYAYVNGVPVLVDPATRRVVYVVR